MKNIPNTPTSGTPLLKAMKLLGGSGTVEEINNKVVEVMSLTGPVLEEMHDPGGSNMTEVEVPV